MKNIEKEKNKFARKSLKKLNKQIKKNKKLNKHPRVEPPHHSILEEIGNAVSHGLGSILAVIGLVLMLIHSKNGYMKLSSIIYMASMFFMCLNSCLYHSFKWGKTVKRIWRRFDYTSIYLMICGTFAPLQLVELGREFGNLGQDLGIAYFALIWLLAIVGIIFTCTFGPERTRKLNFPLYFIIGWSALCMVPGWFMYNRNLFYYIFAGGVVYSLGMIPFGLLRGKNVAHFIWHIFVIVGSIIQFLGIYLYIFLV